MTSRRDNRIKFSKQRVEALPSPASRVAYYYDTETRGLAVSVGKTGRKAFLLYRKILGRPVRLPIGPFPDVTVEQARGQCARLNGEIASGKLPSRPRADLTFAEAFRDYMEKHSQPTKRTSSGDRALYERNLTGKRGWPSLAPRKLSEIDGSQLRAIHRAMHSTPIAANRTMALVSSVFTHAIREGYYEKLNPARTVRKYPERSRERFLRKDEMRFLLEALDAESDGAMVDFVSLAIFTGARRGNILSMRWEEVDLDLREWRISRTKNGDAQVVPLSAPAIQALKRRKERAKLSEWVFPSNSTPGHLVEPKKGWKRILERATALRLREALVAAGALGGSVPDTSLQECREFPAHALKQLQDIAKGTSVDTSRLTMLDLRMHDPVQVLIVQPGERSPSDAVSLKCSMDLSALVARQGFTTNVIRKFIPTLAELGIARLRRQVTEETRKRLDEQSPQENVRVTRVSGSFLFDFKSESAALDALYRIHKHLKVRLDCASRYPGGRQPKAPQGPRVVSEPNSRHEFTTELVHYPHRDSFGQARFSVARDFADMPYGLGIQSTGTRDELSARVRQLLRIDITVDAGKPLPLDDGAFVSVPTNVRELAEMKRNLLEDIWTGFRWAAWVNDDFVTNIDQLDDIDLKPTVKELLDLYLRGEDLMKHYLVQGRSEELLRFRKLLLREAKVDVLVPWAAASLCEARWLRPHLEYGNRLNLSEDPQLAPYSLTPLNADLVASVLLSRLRATGSQQAQP